MCLFDFHYQVFGDVQFPTFKSSTHIWYFDFVPMRYEIYICKKLTKNKVTHALFLAVSQFGLLSPIW